jgi:hypothetical protein
MDLILISIISIFLIIFGICAFIVKSEKKTNIEYKKIEKFSLGSLNFVDQLVDVAQDVLNKGKDITKEIPRLVKKLENIPLLLLDVLKTGFSKAFGPIQKFFIKILPKFMKIVFKIFVKIFSKVLSFLNKKVPGFKYISFAIYGFVLLQFLPIILMINRILAIFLGRKISSVIILFGIVFTYFNITTIIGFVIEKVTDMVLNLNYDELIIDIGKIIIDEFGEIKDQFIKLISF